MNTSLQLRQPGMPVDDRSDKFQKLEVSPSSKQSNSPLSTPDASTEEKSEHDQLLVSVSWALRATCAAFVVVIIAWTTVKLPFYLGMTDTRKEYGAEAIPQLSWHSSFDGFRHTIMTSDKLLFLSFHIVLCDVLLILVVLALLGVSSLRRLSSVFFPTIVVFGLHVIPVADLVPNRSGKGFPANHILLVFLAIGIMTGSFSLFAAAKDQALSSKSSVLIGSWIFLSAVLLGAPIFELLAITSKYGAYARNGQWPAPPDCPFNATSGTVAVYDVGGNVLRYVQWPAPHGAAMYGGMHASLGDVGAYILLVALVVVLFVGMAMCWSKGAGLEEEEEAKQDLLVEL